MQRTKVDKEEYFKNRLFTNESHFSIVINDIHQKEIKVVTEQKIGRDVDYEPTHNLTR